MICLGEIRPSQVILCCMYLLIALSLLPCFSVISPLTFSLPSRFLPHLSLPFPSPSCFSPSIPSPPSFLNSSFPLPSPCNHFPRLFHLLFLPHLSSVYSPPFLSPLLSLLSLHTFTSVSSHFSPLPSSLPPAPTFPGIHTQVKKGNAQPIKRVCIGVHCLKSFPGRFQRGSAGEVYKRGR